MSDPVTNVEIEDVLSSIRRLVSDGDKARTRDPAPVPPAEDTVADRDASAEEHQQNASVEPDAKPEKFVLTPALMVVEAPVDEQPDEVDASSEGWFEEDEADSEPSVSDMEGDEAADMADEEPFDEASEEVDDDGGEDTPPLHLTEMVFDAADTPSDSDAGDAPSDSSDDSTDRSELVATIAELEAAMGGDDDEYEPDGSDTLGQTIAWPGAIARNAHEVEDAETVEEAEPDVDDVALEPSVEEPVPPADTDEADADEYADDDLDGLLDAGGVTIDEEALRELVSEVVRQELTGPMGERITRNVRKLVRREIYRILSSQEFD